MIEFIDRIAAEIIEDHRLLTRMQDIINQPGYMTQIVGMLPYGEGETMVYYRLTSLPAPITLAGPPLELSFSLDPFRDDIMELAQKYASDYRDECRDAFAEGRIAGLPPIDDALLDAIESTIKEGTKLWMKK